MSVNDLGLASAATEDKARKMDRLDGSITFEDTRSGDANQPRVDEFPAGSVYFIELASQGLIKIGSSVNPAGRMKHLESVLPERPILLGTITGGASEEMRWHSRWAPIRRYREWFNATPELRAAIAAAVSGGSP
jgi:hypothetical protein